MAHAPNANLTREACQEQASICRKVAEQVMTPAHRIMLEHIADTWDRIAADIRQGQWLVGRSVSVFIYLVCTNAAMTS